MIQIEVGGELGNIDDCEIRIKLKHGQIFRGKNTSILSDFRRGDVEGLKRGGDWQRTQGDGQVRSRTEVRETKQD